VMPRYLFETDVVSGAQLDAALRLSLHRFPEIAIESLYATRDRDVERVRWVCQAPSQNHIDRWTTLAGLPARALRPKEDG
jgi:hypothetical protein